MICKNCSAQIPDGSKFCTVCGHKIVVEPFVAPKPQQPPQTEPTQAPYTQIPPQVQQGHVPPYNLNGTQQQTVSKNTALDAPLTVLDFFLMSLLSFVPIIGFIFLLIWAFSGNANINRKNYARAALIWILVSIGLVILLSIIGGGILNSMM